MSSCSRQYASRHISGLKKAFKTTSLASPCSPRLVQQPPLLFLYPSWFRQCWHHQYHTDRGTGPDRYAIRKDRNKDRNGRSQRMKDQMQSGSSPSESRASQPLDPVKPSLVKQKKALDPKHNHYRRVVSSEKLYAALSAELDSIQSAPKDQITFAISKAHARRLLGHENADAWIHHEDTGCVVRVFPDVDNGKSMVSLDGSDTACELTEEHIRSPEPVEENEAMIDWEFALRSVSPRSDIDALPGPPRWSVRTFSVYIDALLGKRRHHGVSRISLKERRHHNARVAAKLADLFHGPKTAPFASTTSFEKALRFFREHTELSNHASEIFNAAHDLQVPLSIKAYNEELGRNLIIKNGGGVEKVIHNMRDNHVKPNTETWVFVLKFAEDAGMRRHALEQCLDAGKILIHDPDPSLIHALIKSEMLPYLLLENGVSRFMADLDHVFGHSWLTSRTFARMLRICRIEKAWTVGASELLKEVEKRRDVVQIMTGPCFVELVRIAKKAGNLKDALEIVRVQIEHEGSALYQDILEPLFEMAWLHKSLNLCRLLWLFACTRGQVSFRIKDIMWHSLQGNRDQSDDPETRNWQKLAGKMIVTQPQDIDRIKEALPRLFGDNHVTSVLTKMMEKQTRSEARHEQLQLVQLLIERDIQAWRFYQEISLVDLQNLMMQCYQEDCRLRTSKFWTCPVNALSANLALAKMHKISLKPRGQPLQYPQETRQNPQRGSFVFNDLPLNYDTLEIDMNAVKAQREAEKGSRSYSEVIGQLQSLFPLPTSLSTDLELSTGAGGDDEEVRKNTDGEHLADLSEGRRTTTMDLPARSDNDIEQSEISDQSNRPQSSGDNGDSSQEDETSELSASASA